MDAIISLNTHMIRIFQSIHTHTHGNTGKPFKYTVKEENEKLLNIYTLLTNHNFIHEEMSI